MTKPNLEQRGLVLGIDTRPGESITVPVLLLTDRPGPIAEADLAQELGISREDIRALRTEYFTEGRDWHREKNKVVLYAPEAAEALRKKIGAEQADEALRAALAIVHTLVVFQVPLRNPHIVTAQKKEGGGGAVLRVRVRNNVNFLPGMEIKAKRDAQYPDVFVLEGRCPRFRGRW